MVSPLTCRKARPEVSNGLATGAFLHRKIAGVNQNLARKRKVSKKEQNVSLRGGAECLEVSGSLENVGFATGTGPSDLCNFFGAYSPVWFVRGWRGRARVRASIGRRASWSMATRRLTRHAAPLISLSRSTRCAIHRRFTSCSSAPTHGFVLNVHTPVS